MILFKSGFEPLHRFGIQMVSRLIEQQHIGLLKKQPAKRHTSSFTSGKHIHSGITFRASQGIHCPLKLMFDIPPVGIIDLLLKNSLTLHKLLHLIGIFINLRLTKAIVYFFVLLNYLHRISYSLFNNLSDSTDLIQQGILRQMAH